MVDPISITSLLFEVGNIVSSLINYAKAVKGARADIRKLSEEIFALKGVLEHLQAQVEPKSTKVPQQPMSDAIPYNPETLNSVVQSTSEFLQSLLTELEEPKSKFKLLRKKLEWPFTQEQLNVHLARLERVKSWLILVLMADSAALSRDMYDEINSLTSSLKEDLRIREGEKIKTANEDLCQWLAPVGPANDHLRASKNWEIATGRWFIDGDLKNWVQDNDDPQTVLFLRGKSGIGKTTLFAHAVDELTSTSTNEPDFCLAYFYCTFGNTSSQDPVKIFGSVVTQLSCMMPSMLDSFRPIFAKTRSQAHRPPVELSLLEESIIKHSSGKRRVLIFIDAINESAHMSSIISSLLKLTEQSTNLRVLVTSTADVASLREICPTRAKIVDINPQHDIEAFVDQRLAKDETLRNVSTQLKDDIRRTLLKDADISFRWVQLSLDNLSAQRTGKSVRGALRQLPGTLRETYANMLERVSPSDQKIVRAALSWLCFTNWPLTLAQLNEAVVLDESDTVLEDDSMLVSPLILLQICQGLIDLDMQTVNLAHASIKEFLTSEWILSSKVRYFSLDPSTADKTMMRKCLSYLCLDNFRCGYTTSRGLVWKRLKTNPLLRYAAEFWAIHATSCNLDDTDRHLINRFFDTKRLPRRGNFGLWVQTLIPEADCADIEATQPLYYAASFGLIAVVKTILESDPDVKIDAPGGRRRSTPLFVACWRRHYKVAELLLRAGADPHIEDPSTGLTVFSITSLLARVVQSNSGAAHLPSAILPTRPAG